MSIERNRLKVYITVRNRITQFTYIALYSKERKYETIEDFTEMTGKIILFALTFFFFSKEFKIDFYYASENMSTFLDGPITYCKGNVLHSISLAVPEAERSLAEYPLLIWNYSFFFWY